MTLIADWYMLEGRRFVVRIMVFLALIESTNYASYVNISTKFESKFIHRNLLKVIFVISERAVFHVAYSNYYWVNPRGAGICEIFWQRSFELVIVFWSLESTSSLINGNFMYDMPLFRRDFVLLFIFADLFGLFSFCDTVLRIAMQPTNIDKLSMVEFVSSGCRTSLSYEFSVIDTACKFNTV